MGLCDPRLDAPAFLYLSSIFNRFSVVLLPDLQEVASQKEGAPNGLPNGLARSVWFGFWGVEESEKQTLPPVG